MTSGEPYDLYTSGVDSPLAISGYLTGPEHKPRNESTDSFSPYWAKVMIVDDEPINIDLARIYLQEAGYTRLISTSDATQAIDLMRANRPDVILLDLMMPQVSGFDILAAIRRDPHLRHIPVIILTAANSAESRFRALELGVNEFLGKPVDSSELLLRLRNTLAAKALRDHLASYSARLEREVHMRTVELEGARLEALHCLARAAEYRDDDTGHHVIRVGRYVAILAAELGFDAKQIEILEQAAKLHDLGKIGIPDSILLKPGPLDPNEFEMMKDHCLFGKSIITPLTVEEQKKVRRHTRLGRMILGVTTSPVMKVAASIAETHHEKWNGKGYPYGLSGEAIPIEGRITAVADVFDALSTKRPYKEALPVDQCVEIIERGRGQHFDPRIVDVFLNSINKFVAVMNGLQDNGLERDAQP
ncbi:MAG: response regulator [Planctomycetales bacterium]|nr:response regulator [Planctomycetales bacterium]